MEVDLQASSSMMDSPRILPQPPQTQALSSKTFTPPLLDGALTLPELYDWHLKNTTNHPLFIFHRSNDQENRTILWPEAVRAVHTGARFIRKAMGWKAGLKHRPVVAILAASDTITYFTTTMAVMRAGYIAFPISPRNSSAAVAHLISKVDVKFVLLGHDYPVKNLGKEAVKFLEEHHPHIAKPEFVPIPVFEDLFLDSPQDADDIPYEKPGQEDIAMYLHSSGSTAFPKPIPWTNFRFTQLALIPYFGGRDLTGLIWSAHVMPMFHGMGILHLCWTASCGIVVSAFEPKVPATFPTAQNHFESAVACNSDIILCVPAVIEEWSRKPEYVEWLATREGALFGGGPLNKAVGDYLTSKGVSIWNLYGSTEGGIMSPILPVAKAGYDWEYFRFPRNIKPEMVPQGNGTYEFVMVSNPFCEPSVINTKVNSVKSYATSDLFVKHPEKPGYWKVYGRADDQIMHNSGEKTNPGPLENILNQDFHVQSAVMFGRGQFQAGILIDPKAEYKFDPLDEIKLAEFRNAIWPTVQKMNKFAPQHSRLFKEMIIVCNPSKPFQYTAKNTPRRQVIINDYEKEIKALYDAVADSVQAGIPSPDKWDLAGTLDFVRIVVNKVLTHDAEEDLDIFQQGCDSLQATWIRNTLFRALRDSFKIDTRTLIDSFVYEYPTINSMALVLCQIVTGTANMLSGNKMATRATTMRAMVKKYTQASEFITSPRNNNLNAVADNGDTVLVTGTTGALGSYILAELAHRADVRIVYAINRTRQNDTGSLRERQKKALIDRGLDSGLIDSKKVVLLEADISLPRFGLAEDLYTEMSSTITHIVHNAWPVDFNLSLASFETSIKGLRNLVDLALGSPLKLPATLIYTSSIGVFQNTNLNETLSLKESPINAEIAIGTGYTESKWVSEEILMHFSKHRKLNSIIVRVGQLSGGLNGCWNVAEWLPSLVKSSLVLGCLPTDDKMVDWIHLDMAAKALVDFRKGGSQNTSTFAHLIHPSPVLWSSLAHTIAEELSVRPVSFQYWMEKLEEASKENSRADEGLANIQSLREIPALRLLGFFRSLAERVNDSANAFGFNRLACDTALRLSPTLSSSDRVTSPLDADDVRAWLRYWRGVGFLSEAVDSRKDT